MDGNASGDTREAPAIDAPPPSGPAGTPISAPPPSGPPGTPAAQPPTPPDPLAAAVAGPGERGKLRRRLRRLKRTRERQFAELGTLVVDARKRSSDARPPVVDRRAAEVAEVDRQVRELAYAVEAEANPRALATGVQGSCTSCGNLLATEDRFCPECGTPTKAKRARPEDTSPVEPRRATAAADSGAPEPPVIPGPAQPAAMPGAIAGPPPPLPTAPYAAVDPAKIPPPPPPPGAEQPAAPSAPPIPEAPPPTATAYTHVDRSTIPPPPPPPAG